MVENLIERGYIPLDKSWMNRMGVLDLTNGYSDITGFLKQHHTELNDDLKALYRASKQWLSGEPIDVGESGTLYRFLKFASWKLGQQREFVTSGTLTERSKKFTDEPKIVDWPLEELLTLDNGTSQWASASVLMGNRERLQDPPYKLQVTYDAVDHWFDRRSVRRRWEPKYDETVLGQAEAYLRLSNGRGLNFIPQQAEDYCLARAFELMTPEEGERRWRSLRGHETDRIDGMEEQLAKEVIDSEDHRVVQAIAMRYPERIILHPRVVNKSWPQFWKFIEETRT